ncbi:ArsR family transcriptional regulator [Paenibacillus chitinolyticus]|uniref:ArsR family transcriptional regulator n=1 Tax=Paenibacillus chitinolyticus TaxID=79263 RepID=A0A410WZI1_9BACL|nr:metalloregulator ArsR/SmtB family transcription factor [Paenibacillus chitinolyticus]MCY9590141.1 metalloregulator ArsR/SmtB family transcription factor [Paenibacillus chitinolyticus]MCY9596837.1 metalloregulator ArsR/SmtB family transcription factor [Paenibacillus chitinolyticus]QAV19848.1 ArsR family transcriptional regulator [Paenibacillus chitinolyticus]
MEQLQSLADTFKLMGDKTRLTILALLRERELCVCDLVDVTGMSQPSISQHLRKMKDAGLVSERRKGQWIYYSLAADHKDLTLELLRQVPSMSHKIAELEENTDGSGRCG